jgi:flagellar basal-body rod modification protein FlgD
VSTSAINGANNATSAADTSNDNKKKTDQMGNGLGQDAFLQLLVTQLQHQDPMQPQDDSQFLAQLAQFSSLEQLTEMNKSIQQLVTLAGTNNNSSNNNSNANNSNDNSTSNSNSSTNGTTN